MAKAWKDVLKAGRYRLQDGRVVTYTKTDIQQAEKNGNAMIAAGLRCPGCWEHDQLAEPTYLSQSSPMASLARNYWGEATAFKVQGDVLLAELNVPDEADAKQLAKVKTVSPRIDFDFVDEQGKLWPGCSIGHVASTPKPVQRDQKPVMFSQVGIGQPKTTRRETHFLSLAVREASTMDPKKASELLAKMGIHLGEGLTDWDDFGKRLEAAVATKTGGEGGDDDDPSDDGLGSTVEGGASDAVSTASPPAMLSQVDSRVKQLIGAEREDLARRVDKLIRTGRIDGPTHRKLKAAVSSVNLSLATDGKLKFDPLIARIEAFETLPANAAMKALGGKPADLSQATIASPPPELRQHDGKADALAFLRKKIDNSAQTVSS